MSKRNFVSTPTMRAKDRMDGDIKVGDAVFDRNGKPCNVTALSPVFEQPDLFDPTVSC